MWNVSPDYDYASGLKWARVAYIVPSGMGPVFIVTLSIINLVSSMIR